ARRRVSKESPSMFHLRTKTIATPSRPAEVFLQLIPGGPTERLDCEVVRITPDGLRLALGRMPTVTLPDLHARNPQVEVILRMPAPMHQVRTRGAITGATINYDRESPPFYLDVEFPDLTEAEEQALRDSHPELVVI